MKRLTALIIAAALCAGLCGCASTVSVSGAQIDADGHLILSMSDGSTLDAGLARGEKGEKGDKGDKGEQGIQGLPGEKGEKGDKGDRGPRGEKGERGAQGIQGERGATGYSGGSGASGRDGVDGKTPYIGENGHWWIDGKDTGVPATVSPGTKVTSAEDIKKAIEDGTAEISLMNDLTLSEPLKITADTVIHGNGYKVKLDSDIDNPIFNGGDKKSLTLDNMTLDGQNKRVNGYFGAINGGEDSSLTLSNVTIENVEAERIIRAVSVESVNLTNVTIRNNKTSNSKDHAYGLLFTNVKNMTLKNVSITNNDIEESLILIWGDNELNALTAESLTIENNTIGEHILATSGTNCSDTITLTSGSIKGNNTAGIYMVGNLTIGKDMNVQCGITLNNDSAKGVCTLTNDGTITGDITSANWAVQQRERPNYTGTGTHNGTKTNITDLTAPVQP